MYLELDWTTSKATTIITDMQIPMHHWIDKNAEIEELPFWSLLLFLCFSRLLMSVLSCKRLSKLGPWFFFDLFIFPSVHVNLLDSPLLKDSGPTWNGLLTFYLLILEVKTYQFPIPCYKKVNNLWLFDLPCYHLRHCSTFFVIFQLH